MAGMVGKNNMAAINTLNTLNRNQGALTKSLAKVSSGMKINGAADDASGYAISERMRVQIRSLDQANQNTQNGSSMMKVAEGAVSSTVEILKTLKQKVINAANDSNTDKDRATIQKELDQSIDQINDNANVTFNGKYLVDGTKNGIGQATRTTFTNQSLSTNTTMTTALTALKNRAESDLEISTDDKVTVSFTAGGKTYTSTVSLSVYRDVSLSGLLSDTNILKFDNGNVKISDYLAAGAIQEGEDDNAAGGGTNATYESGASTTAGNAYSTNTGFAQKVESNGEKWCQEQTRMADANTPITHGDDKLQMTGVSSATNVIGVDASGTAIKTVNGENALTITARTAGIKGQVGGFTISISDKNGQIKKSANAALDKFSEGIRAQDRSNDNAITLQVGTEANQAIKVGLTDMRAEALGLQGSDGTKLNITTQAKANAAITVLDNAVQKALDQQTTIGSVESRLEYTASNLTTASENVQASESTIRDADMAKEMTEYTKNNVLLQAAQSMLAQANQNSSSVLSLLQ